MLQYLSLTKLLIPSRNRSRDRTTPEASTKSPIVAKETTTRQERHSRQVITRDRILEKVWGYDFMGESNIIEVYIRALRIKLEASNSKRLLHTVRGVGYVLREQK